MGPWKIEQFTDAFGDLNDALAELPTPQSLASLSEPPYADSILNSIDTYLRITAGRFGSVYGFMQEQSGVIVQNLFPIQTDQTKQISSSSKVELEMHTETAFHPWRPTTVILLCVRGDASAGTRLASLPDIVDLLSGSCLEILHRQEFVTGVDESFLSSSDRQKSILTSVLFDGATEICYDRALMVGLTPEGKWALKQLSNAIDEVQQIVHLQTGEMLILNNRTVIHGRTPFQARYDGTDRWLKRVMVSTKLPGPEEIEWRNNNDRVVTSRF